MGHRRLWISIDKRNRYFSGGKITASCCRGHCLSCTGPNVSEISSGCVCPAMATYDILEIAGTCFLNIKLCRDFHFWHSFIAGAAIVNLILQSNTKYAIKLQQWIIIFQYVFICIACISYISITDISHTIDAFRMHLLMYASHRPLYFHCVLYMFGICAGMAPIKLCGPLIHPYMLLECIPASYMYM